MKGLLQLLDHNIPPANLVGAGACLNSVHLQSDGSGWTLPVDVSGKFQLGNLVSVDEGGNGVALGDDVELVPIVVFHVLVASPFIGFFGDPPRVEALPVDEARLSGAGFDFDLSTEIASAAEIAAVRTDLDPGVQAFIYFHFELQLEIAELVVSGQEGIRASFGGTAENGAILYVVISIALNDAPSGECFAIKERLPAMVPMGVGEERCGGCPKGQDSDFNQGIFHCAILVLVRKFSAGLAGIDVQLPG